MLYCIHKSIAKFPLRQSKMLHWFDDSDKVLMCYDYTEAFSLLVNVALIILLAIRLARPYELVGKQVAYCAAVIFSSTSQSVLILARLYSTRSHRYRISLSRKYAWWSFVSSIYFCLGLSICTLGAIATILFEKNNSTFSDITTFRFLLVLTSISNGCSKIIIY